MDRNFHFIAYQLRLLFILALGTSVATANPNLEETWVLTGFDSPESVIQSDSDNSLFVSNVNGEGNAKDGNGYISLISREGKVLNKNWVTGLNAPKGMAIKSGKLYVSDIDELVVIDIETQRIDQRVSIEGAKFLNDVAAIDDGILVSDSATQQIFIFQNGEAQSWLKDERLDGVNGLLANKQAVLVSTMSEGELLEVSLKDKSIRRIAANMKNADGIGKLTSGDYIVSSWPGQLYFVSTSGDVAELLNTEDKEILMNDLFLSDNLLVVPNWKPGTVRAYNF